MIERVEIEQRLLHRLSGGLAAGELAEWARSILAFANAEGPTLFAPEEDLLRDVLKRCAVASDPPFELSEDEMRILLRRVAFSGAQPVPNRSAKGPFLVAFRARLAPGRLFPIMGLCARCEFPVRISTAMLPKARRTAGALVCLWCARAIPGIVVEGV